MVVILPLGRTYDFSKCRFLLQHRGAKESNSGNECGRGSEESMLKNSIRWVGLFSSDHWVNVLFLFHYLGFSFPGNLALLQSGFVQSVKLNILRSSGLFFEWSAHFAFLPRCKLDQTADLSSCPALHKTPFFHNDLFQHELGERLRWYRVYSVRSLPCFFINCCDCLVQWSRLARWC